MEIRAFLIGEMGPAHRHLGDVVSIFTAPPLWLEIIATPSLATRAPSVFLLVRPPNFPHVPDSGSRFCATCVMRCQNSHSDTRMCLLHCLG